MLTGRVGVLGEHRPGVRHFPGLTVVNAGTLKRDEDPGFAVLDLDHGEVRYLGWALGRIEQRETASIRRR